MLSRCTNLLAGFTRLVRLVRRAWRILVLARVFLNLCAWAMSGAAEQSMTRGTVRPDLGPVSQRHFRSSLPRGLRFQTILCSVTNSQALILYLIQILQIIDPQFCRTSCL